MRNHFVFTHFVFELRTSFTLNWFVLLSEILIAFCMRIGVTSWRKLSDVMKYGGGFDTWLMRVYSTRITNHCEIIFFFYFYHWELGIWNKRQKEDFECSCHFSSDKEQVQDPLFYMRTLIVSQRNKQKHTIISRKRIPGILCARYPLIFHWNGWINKCWNWQMIQIEKQ